MRIGLWSLPDKCGRRVQEKEGKWEIEQKERSRLEEQGGLTRSKVGTPELRHVKLKWSSRGRKAEAVDGGSELSQRGSWRLRSPTRRMGGGNWARSDDRS